MQISVEQNQEKYNTMSGRIKSYNETMKIKGIFDSIFDAEVKIK